MRASIAAVISLGLAGLGTQVAVTEFTAARPPPLPVAEVSGPVAVSYSLPLAAPARVVEIFKPPATSYSAGHRGVDLAVPRSGRVFAAADGEVTFAGSVGGRGLVVVRHVDGIATEYEPLRPSVHAGERVRRGTLLGDVSGRHRTCARDACLHWSARRGQTYLDPMSLLGSLGPVRLVPWP